jgi:hypothetical protein
MEYIEGETLAARIKKGALPLDETLRIAKPRKLRELSIAIPSSEGLDPFAATRALVALISAISIRILTVRTGKTRVSSSLAW